MASLGDRHIGALPPAPAFDKDTLLVCERQGNAERISGEQIGDYVESVATEAAGSAGQGGEGSGGGTGTLDHDRLRNRSAAHQHPAGSIDFTNTGTSLEAANVQEAIAELDRKAGAAETDPTVPQWAKRPYKPVYDANEIGFHVPWMEAGTVEEAILAAMGSGGGGGVTAHNDLDGRDANDCHPIGAITGLESRLNTIESDIAELSNHDGGGSPASWQSVEIGSNVNWTRVVPGDGVWIALSDSGVGCGYSADGGLTWELFDMPSPGRISEYADGFWSDAAFHNGVFIAVSSGGVIARSTNGRNWTTETRAMWFHSVAGGGGRFVISGDARSVTMGYSLSSTDGGLSWTETETGWSAYSLGYGNGIFIGIVVGNYAYRSVDGVTWESSRMNTSGVWRIVYGNGVFVFLFGGAGNADCVQITSDGITFERCALPEYTWWTGLGFNGDYFVAVSRHDGISAYSTNGKAWTKLLMADIAPWADAAGKDGRFIAVSQSGGVVNYLDIAALGAGSGGNVDMTAVSQYVDNAISEATRNMVTMDGGAEIVGPDGLEPGRHTINMSGLSGGGGSGTGQASSAANVVYDNTASGAAATNVQGALDELFTSGSNGKALIASAITAKGVNTAADATFAEMANNISNIATNVGSANPAYIWDEDIIKNFSDTLTLTLQGEYHYVFGSMYLVNKDDGDISDAVFYAVKPGVGSCNAQASSLPFSTKLSISNGQTIVSIGSSDIKLTDDFRAIDSTFPVWAI